MTTRKRSILVHGASRRIDLAYVELASSELARDINRDIVLEIIRSQQPISRAELSRASGLQPSTVSNIVDQLLTEKWIVEGAVARRPRGRRPTLLSLNDQLCILVADIRPGKTTLAVVDLNGRLLAHEEVRISSNAQRSSETIVTAMLKLRDRFPGYTFEGAGISVPGRVHPETQRLILAPNLKWTDFDLRTALARKLKLQVEIDNDATACLLSELWFGRMDGIRNAVLVSLSEGLGTAILANGHIVSGLNGLAGEFGHISVDPNGPMCGCGQRGCWEMFASSRAALRYYAEESKDTGKIAINGLVALAVDGNKAARRALERQAVAIGRGLRMLNAVLAPEVVLFAGDITTFWQMSEATIRAESQGGLTTGSLPKLVSIGDGEMARLRGAAAVVLQRHTGYYRASHNKRREAEAEAAAMASARA